MKLWLLRPNGVAAAGEYDEDQVGELWRPCYDKAFGFVIRAETEGEARAIAQDHAGDELHERSKAETDPAWLSAEHSTCTELTANGLAGLIIRDFAAA